MFTESIPSNRLRLNELVQNARKTDSDVEISGGTFAKRSRTRFWKEAVQPYDWILYVSQYGNVNELRNLNLSLQRGKEVIYSRHLFRASGASGPLVHPESEGCWESAWRRIHQSALHREQHPNLSLQQRDPFWRMSLYSNFSRRLQELPVQIRVIKFTCLILKHWKVIGYHSSHIRWLHLEVLRPDLSKILI